ncbi:OmpA family protein [Balneatrix alpica]|uniref:OmpA family protein n=1 Tax=Balneatrix alpica TaxID=75684 RepID=A0ABV5Z6T9_9GAMM|nr:OmpA family protein [Balneatrix alpica]
MTVLALAMAASGFAFATPDTHSYWVDSKGVVVKDGSGACLRTSQWKAEDISVCTGEKPAEPAPVVAEPVYQNVEQSLTVYFPHNVATLSEANQARLAEFVGNVNSTFNSVEGVAVAGHASSPGSDGYNLRLSQKRANNVVSSLNSLGVSNAAVNAYGETDLVFDANGKEDQERSRRVVVDVVGKKKVN